MEKLLGLPVLASEHGKDVDKLIVYVHYLMLALFIGWLAYFIYVLFRFHKSKNPKADYVGVRGHASTWIEVAVAAIEAVLLIGFAVPLWAKVVSDYPPEKDSTVMRVVAEQFGWNVRYPGKDGTFGKADAKFVDGSNKLGLDQKDPNGKDDIQTLNEIHVQVNKPVLIHLTSRDVIHSFKVIAMRVCQDAIPGLSIPVHFTPTKVGKYQINCAQLCGTGHFGMALGFITVDSPEDFKKWNDEKTASAGKSATSFE
ncbi:MAG TPA: cytochrome c oxidase subunit II [Verrucomicrobiae bacterium]|nr:cytochrome c oxidase subunit II [Verrucomicrobiae bacterium]